MFTGIIEGLGTIQDIQPSKGGRRLTIQSDISIDDETRIGDSIAVNGACLTVVHRSQSVFSVDISPETVLKTTFRIAHIGERVNLERALRLSDRLNGHLVSGHIDTTAEIKQKRIHGNAIEIQYSMDRSLLKYVITKGSIAIDGISLTVNSCSDDGFEVSIIPHTAKLTTIGFKDAGQFVNIETDMIAKYIEKLFLTSPKNEKHSQGLTMDFLEKSGFIH
ncbi:MAG: riboflavin synthase [Desulfobacterales bacterium]|nr:riboflavin synthase [Desulfobacterales bacterium]